jgi:hypothetical protein
MGPLLPIPLNYKPPSMVHTHEWGWILYLYYKPEFKDEILQWCQDNLGEQNIGFYIPRTNIWVGFFGNWRHMTTANGWMGIWIKKRHATLFALTWL